MARPGLTKHRKFGRLARRLGSPIVARGVLELLWDGCYESGDATVGTAEDVAYAVGWAEDAEALAGALLDTGFLDRDDEGGYVVHDLFDHAPDYVLKRYRREQERRERGAKRRRTAVTDGQTAPNGRTPALAQAPAPIEDHAVDAAVTDRRTPDGAADPDDGFATFWESYPRHTDKAAAEKAWHKLHPSIGLQEIILAAVADQRTWPTWRESQYIPHASTWLHRRRWDDERPAGGSGPANRAPVASDGRTWAEHQEAELAAIKAELAGKAAS